MPAKELLSNRQALLPLLSQFFAQFATPIAPQIYRSAWPRISQRAVIFARGAILFYFIVLSSLVPSQLPECPAAYHAPLCALLDFPSFALSRQWVWHFDSFVWSLMHRHWAANDNYADSRHWWTRPAVFFLSSENVRASVYNFHFNTLYTTAHVFNFMNTIMYWGGVPPRAQLPNTELAGTGWLQSPSVFHMYGVTTLIAITEIMFLNTINHHHMTLSYVFLVSLYLVVYLALAAYGNTLTGDYVFFWMDPKQMGSTGLVVASGAGFVALGLAMFAALHGLTSLREKLTRHIYRREGYTRIHDSDDESTQIQRGRHQLAAHLCENSINGHCFSCVEAGKEVGECRWKLVERKR